MGSTKPAAFEPVSQHRIQGLGLDARLWRHPCGAMHLHLDLPGDESSFFVAFRTPPSDSTGVAHILEHTTLCGSRRYPVRDPFFAMLTRSLATFMNAMTASDWTAYPFATRVDKDFSHLLDVYLDAVFFPNLHPLDFAQEGHRLERADGELQLAGVVFNEMKGAISSPTSVAYNALGRALMRGSIYAHESGGDPLAIPDLRHEDLVAFHRRCYTPANAVFFSSGPCDPAQLQQRWIEVMERRAESDGWGETLRIPQIPRLQEPAQVAEPMPTTPSKGDRGDQVLLAWLLHPSADSARTLRLHVLSNLLLDNSGSPLRAMLEGCEWSTSPAPITGMDDSLARVWFSCGLDGLKPEDAAKVEPWLLQGLQKIAEQGFSEEAVQASLRQLEFQQLELGGDRMPFGLELGLEALSAMIHHADPMPALDPMPQLAQLREQLQGRPEVVGQWLREFLLDNPHRVALHLQADPEWQGRRAASEERRLAQAKEGFGEDDWQRLEREQQQLAQRQAQQDDPGALPRLRMDDIPRDIAWTRPAPSVGGLCHYEVPGNGILETRLAVHLNQLTAEDLELLPLYSRCLDELGTHGRDFRATAEHRASWLGSFHASHTVRGNGEGGVTGWLSVGARCLAQHQEVAVDEMTWLLDEVRFDEHERVADLLVRTIAARERGLAGSGHSLAAMAAASGLHPLAQWRHRTGGLAGLQVLRGLRDRYLPQDAGELCQRLEQLHGRLVRGARCAALISDKASLTESGRRGDAVRLVSALLRDDSWPSQLQLPPLQDGGESGWIIDAGVHHCAAAVPGPAFGDRDAAALAVASQWMRQRYLHPRVRESGGAYGVGSSCAGDTRSFQWFSYRDPQMATTLDHFSAGAEHLLAHIRDDTGLEEAILAAVGGFDKRGSSFGEAAATFGRGLAGVPELRLREHRAELLRCNARRVREAAEKWLLAEPVRAVLGGPESADTMRELGLQVTDLIGPAASKAA